MKKITLEELASIVSEKLTEHGIDSVLVGGGCVSIYSQNRYQSYDLDYVTYTDMKKVEKALKELDFKKEGKYFRHKDCEFFIEFVSPPVSIGDEAITQFEYHHTSLGTIKMLTPTDSIKDRLASYYHWGDREALDQAIAITCENKKKIDFEEIKRWSKKEKHLDKFNDFINKI